MQLDKICEEMAEHIVKMCMSDLSVDHADFRLKELKAEELFLDIQQKVNQQLAAKLWEMSKNEATIQNARDRVKILVSMKSGLFVNLPAEIKRLKETENERNS